MSYQNCIKSNNGNTYCYDGTLHKWIKYTKEEVVSIKEVPEDVLVGTADRLNVLLAEINK